jgi:PadR family transcriptional regulator, regulatory protein AphA
MPKRSSSGPEVLLGLLTIQPMSGYDLRQTIRHTVGHFWNESYGQIYPNLKRLADGGFVKCRTERQEGKPDRYIYSITAKGRERLRTWLEVPPQQEVPRNELLLKLFLGDQTSPEVLIGYVEEMARQCRAVLESVEKAVREGIDGRRLYPAAPYWNMAARFGLLEMEAHLRWAEETAAELRKAAARRSSGAQPGRSRKNADS